MMISQSFGLTYGMKRNNPNDSIGYMYCRKTETLSDMPDLWQTNKSGSIKDS